MRLIFIRKHFQSASRNERRFVLDYFMDWHISKSSHMLLAAQFACRWAVWKHFDEMFQKHLSISGNFSSMLMMMLDDDDDDV